MAHSIPLLPPERYLVTRDLLPYLKDFDVVDFAMQHEPFLRHVVFATRVRNTSAGWSSLTEQGQTQQNPRLSSSRAIAGDEALEFSIIFCLIYVPLQAVPICLIFFRCVMLLSEQGAC